MKIKELFSDEGKWTQGAAARRPDNTMCDAVDTDAARWCLAGASVKCYGDGQEHRDTLSKIRAYLNKPDKSGILASIGGQAWHVRLEDIICKKTDMKTTELMTVLKPISEGLDVLKTNQAAQTQQVAELRALIQAGNVDLPPEIVSGLAAIQAKIDGMKAG